jgi:hypothetical protein
MDAELEVNALSPFISPFSFPKGKEIKTRFEYTRRMTNDFYIFFRRTLNRGLWVHLISK